jgi:hypothetical protein
MYSFFERDNFFRWYLNIKGTTGTDFFSNFLYDPFYSVEWVRLDSGQYVIGLEGGHPGVWTAVATPEPGTLALLGIGMVGLLARRRSKSDILA